MLRYSLVRPEVGQADPARVAPFMFWLMFRNVASDGLVFDDPVNADVISQPGCVLASPSWENTATAIRQDYVYHWTRDGAVVAFELSAAYAAGTLPDNQPLIDYVRFSQICQAAPGDFDRASYYISGTRRPWTDQSDGPAMQTLALLAVYQQLDPPTQATALALIDADLNFLATAYTGQTYNLWEEEYGASFWCYQSVLPVPSGKAYDPNIDVVMAAVYGAEPVTDTRLLAHAAQLRAQWAEPGECFYPINADDAGRGIGPLPGRYPADVYDGDTDAEAGDHPWALTTANFAELYYRLAGKISSSRTVPVDSLSAPFFAQVGADAGTAPLVVAAALRAAGDRMLQAIVFHSDHFELSEQFDAVTGFEKSVRNLSWSYAAFLSAVRARGAPG